MVQTKETFGMTREELDEKIRPLGGRFRRQEDQGPRLYVSFGRGIMMFPLQGRQSLGRMDVDNNPDIAIDNSFVSRSHGFFDSYADTVTYTAVETKNGIHLNNRLLKPGECVELQDGDELTIPARDSGTNIDILLVCAFSKSKIDVWEMLRHASKDRLTSLPDRGMFSSWYLQHCHTGKWSKGCIFLLDVDDFKSINDAYGHSVGDRVLRRVAQRLIQMLDSAECIGRWGGDEFAGLIPDHANETMQRLDSFRKHIATEDIYGKVQVTVSIGFVAMEDLDGVEDLEAAIEKADQALYMAKLDGKNRVSRYRRKSSADGGNSTETRTWDDLYLE